LFDVGITARERGMLSIAAIVIAVFGMGFSLLGIIGAVLFRAFTRTAPAEHRSVLFRRSRQFDS
jgi:hypothetical protein